MRDIRSLRSVKKQEFKEGDSVLWTRANHTSNAHIFPKIPATVHRLKLDRVVIKVIMPDGKPQLKSVTPETLEIAT